MTEPAANDFVTTELAPTMQFLPNFTPCKITTPQPIKQSSPIVIGSPIVMPLLTGLILKPTTWSKSKIETRKPIRQSLPILMLLLHDMAKPSPIAVPRPMVILAERLGGGI